VTFVKIVGDYSSSGVALERNSRQDTHFNVSRALVEPYDFADKHRIGLNPIAILVGPPKAFVRVRLGFSGVSGNRVTARFR
jgi:hypothetical protein